MLSRHISTYRHLRLDGLFVAALLLVCAACSETPLSTNSDAAGGGGHGGAVNFGGTGGVGGTPPTALDEACTPSFTLDLQDQGPGGQLFLDIVVDPEGFVQAIGRDVCRILYRDAGEVRATNTLTLIVKEDEVPGWKSGDAGDITVMISSSHLLGVKDAGGDVAAEIEGVLSHEMTHMYQNDDKASGEGSYENLGNVIEGVADAVRIRRGFIPNGAQPSKGGSWDDQGYTKPAFFLLWIDNVYPDFLYQLNAGMLAGDGVSWAPASIAQITGEGVDSLWADYLMSSCCSFSELGCCQ